MTPAASSQSLVGQPSGGSAIAVLPPVFNACPPPFLFLSPCCSLLEAALSYERFHSVYMAAKEYACCEALNWLGGLWLGEPCGQVVGVGGEWPQQERRAGVLGAARQETTGHGPCGYLLLVDGSSHDHAPPPPWPPLPGLLIVGCSGVPMALLAFWWLGRMDKLEPRGCASLPLPWLASLCVCLPRRWQHGTRGQVPPSWRQPSPPC